jgi:ABC-type Mn2+/Zn2+ transport system ATPase subunit
MPSIHLDHVCFSYTSFIDVFDDVDLHIGPGWTGVVGPNGSGKSTLLSLRMTLFFHRQRARGGKGKRQTTRVH